ncbi:uncharacterized protein BX663DRAFT_482297 [Cokeromyces recurvatus]|uniref:uncharacterized protein n=1 Tax=Cokeromyces recurvatus TaxID=90255 RepID=UPI002221259B|nr:uncharacterized protein BX663DRAFT_482297 [Cokeromyces recurvatus]KAI7908064.1 hypothetical protein BX663DRAFT_482297 [Cokeromyces recurvatus]
MNEQQNDQEMIQKEYENMTYDEISQRLTENYKQLSEFLGDKRISFLSDTTTQSSLVSDLNTNCFDDIEDNDYLDTDLSMVVTNDTQQRRITKLFLQSVSSGNQERVEEFLSKLTSLGLDIDAKDEDNGTTALIYAACFGKVEIAAALLSAGAQTDIQDSCGWTALMWATANHHEKLIKLLLDHGASAQTKSANGRTVFDFVKRNDKVNADIFATSTKTSTYNDLSLVNSSDNSVSRLLQNYTNDDKYISTEEIEGKDMFIESPYISVKNHLMEDIEDESHREMVTEFNWNKCMPDQMFVFAADNLCYILDSVITTFTLPISDTQEIFVPANVIFLSARFAYYFSNAELIEDVIKGAIDRIDANIKNNRRDIHVLSFWLSNMTRLLYYLKKDIELVVATAEHQLCLSELISETYTYIVNVVERQIMPILQPAMLEYDLISGMESIDFADDDIWQRFFSKRKNDSHRESMMEEKRSCCMKESLSQLKKRSPKSITHLLSSIHHVLQSYEVHSTIIIQALTQFFHFLSCELFNQILANKKYLCRSKAIQIRMNLSILEEWIHQQQHSQLPVHLLISYLTPSIQLVQLLQCLSQLTTPDIFKSTVAMFETMNPLQIRRCVTNYRYETQEPRLPEEIETLVNQMVNETKLISQPKGQDQTSTKRRSLLSLFERYNKIETNVTTTTTINEEEGDNNKENMNETKDSRFLLPFFVPTTTQLSNSNIALIPIIPENWMDKLDKTY